MHDELGAVRGAARRPVRAVLVPRRGGRPRGRSPQAPANKSASAPAVVEELDYEQLTLAQLRARLQSLDVDELEALLAYEEATKGRAPFQTLLANRITRATAK